ncbi:hypothetical protein D3C87_985870 [compost metagenome]
MGEAFDANLAALRFDGLGGCPIQRDEGGIIDTVLHQRLGKLHAGARADAIRIHGIIDDAETLSRAQIGIGRLGLRIVGKRKALLIGIECCAIILGSFESLRQPVQGLGAGADGAAQLVGIDGGGSGLPGNRIIIGDLRRLFGKLRPERAVVRRDSKRLFIGRDRIGNIARGCLLPRRLHEGFHALSAFTVIRRKAGFQPARFLLQTVSDEGQALRRADIGFRYHFHDLAGNRAGESVQLIEIRFEEAPFHLGIVGEGLADGIAYANLAALLQRDILLSAKIEAEIIAVLGGNNLAGGLRRHGWRKNEGGRGHNQRNPDERAQRHQYSPRIRYVGRDSGQIHAWLSTHLRQFATRNVWR